MPKGPVQAAQCGQLPLGQLPGGGQHFGATFFQSRVTFKPGPYLKITHASHRSMLRTQKRARAQLSDLIEQTLLEHLIKAPCNALMKYIATGRRQQKSQRLQPRQAYVASVGGYPHTISRTTQ